jgi:putative ABC transport system permease protein
MLLNYLRIALRDLYRNKIYAFINIAGLAIGLAAFILVGVYIAEEISYDTYFSKAEVIYRINTKVDVNGVQNTYAGAHYPAAYDMVKEFPVVKKALTLYNAVAFQGVVPVLKYEDRSFSEQDFIFSDSTFFSFFDYPLLYGKAEDALREPYSLVLTDETSKKFFGNTNPVGKMVTFNDSVSFRITGVLAPTTFKTHLKFDYLAYANPLIQSLIGRNIRLEDQYIGLWYYSYIMLAPTASPADLVSQFPGFVKKHYPPRYTDNHAELTLQNIRDIHLKSNFAGSDMSVNGNMDYVYILSIIGVLILVIACINFVNLSTARYMNRAKEVGLRKAIGAQRLQLILQFTGEAVMISCVAGVIAFVSVIAIVPLFNVLAHASIQRSDVFNPQTIVVSMVIFFCVGLLSGLYPAFVLSGFQPVKVLKGMAEPPGQKFNLRKVLVTLQFSVSMALIIGTLVVYSQLDYLQHKSMGFDREQILMIPVADGSIAPQYATFKKEISRLTQVRSVTNVSHDLGQKNLPYFPMIVEGKDEEQMIPVMYAGYDFLETFGVAMASGRYFDQEFRSDSTLAYVVNETAARTFGWPDAVGRKIKAGFGGSDSTRVIGMIKDFNFDPLKSNIGPLAIAFGGAFGNVAVKMAPGNNRETIERIAQSWKELYPQTPFAYYFLDEGLKATYENESRISKIYTLFCSIALFIACMGLFALASYTIRKRLKEISMRKVLGASQRSIVLLIYRDFLLLIVVAFAIATPASIYIFHQWLSTFAYRIDLHPAFFLLAVITVIAISWVTLGFQLVRASRVNPATILRSE